MLYTFIICLLAGMGAGVGTGFAGMSAAVVISPMLITFLDTPAYQAVGIALASDVLASAVSCYNYKKNGNLDIKNGLIMMVSVLIFTMVGSYVSKFVPNNTMGGFSNIMTLILGVKFIIKPVMTTKEAMLNVDKKKRVIQSIVCGVLIGFICGFIGAGGGIMMLLILTSVLGYELKTAVGTSVFIMTFTALTGAISHFVIGGIYDIYCLIFCMISTFVFAMLSSKIANKSTPKVLNRITGIVISIIGLVMLIGSHLK
ncbi:MAG: sulfite exporter TauE/SafE family protein [Oscillospiraceae bacterium]